MSNVPSSTVENFTPHLDPAAVADLQERIARTRLPQVPDADHTEQGLSQALVTDLVRHWRDDLDWSTLQARLAEHAQVQVLVGDEVVHAIHERAADDEAPVVVLLHGWPDSFLRYRHVVRPLVDAGFHVVVPSLPGTAWSQAPRGAMTLAYAAEQVHGLLTALGYERYAVHGGDWGAGVADALTSAHPEAVTALHLTDVPFSKTFEVDRESATPAEVAYLERFDAFGADPTDGGSGEGLYYTIQSAIPMTFSLGLTDSPAALAAWHLDKFRRWSEREITSTRCCST